MKKLFALLIFGILFFGCTDIVKGIRSELNKPTPSRLEAQSKNYWKQNSPFSIDAYKASGTTLDLVIKNNDAETLYLREISGNGIVKSAFNTSFRGGDEKTITLMLERVCTKGANFQYSNITIIYDKTNFTGLDEIGTLPLDGTCS